MKKQDFKETWYKTVLCFLLSTLTNWAIRINRSRGGITWSIFLHCTGYLCGHELDRELKERACKSHGKHTAKQIGIEQKENIYVLKYHVLSLLLQITMYRKHARVMSFILCFQNSSLDEFSWKTCNLSCLHMLWYISVDNILSVLICIT